MSPTLDGVEFNEVIKRRRMVHAFTAEPLAPGHRGAAAAGGQPGTVSGLQPGLLVPSARRQTGSRAVLAAASTSQTASEATTKDDSPEQVDALSTAPLVIVPLASKDVYLDRYARPEKGWTDRDEARMPIPYWYIDTGFTALLIQRPGVDRHRQQPAARRRHADRSVLVGLNPDMPRPEERTGFQIPNLDQWILPPPTSARSCGTSWSWSPTGPARVRRGGPA